MKYILVLLMISAFGCTKPQPPPLPSPTPNPTVIPSASSTPEVKCPCLVRWGIGKDPHVLLDAAGHLSQLPAQVGGQALYDTTARFEQYPGDKNGKPCDIESDNCGGRKCSDPRGPDFAVTGPGPWHVNSNPFQVKLTTLSPGRYTIRATPRADMKDELGVKVLVCPQAGDGGTDFTSLTVQ